MTTELLPVGVRCNLACRYCYDANLRRCEQPTRADIDRMIRTGLSRGGKLSIHGGEPLLTPIADLEKIFKISFEKYGSSGLQTNGTLITDEHIRLFRKYNVGIGISIDGPGDLNDLRCPADGDTAQPTERTLAGIERLTAAGIRASIIVTVHKANGIPSRLGRLIEFAWKLAGLGIVNINFHTLQIPDDDKPDFALSSAENAAAFLRLAGFMDVHPKLRWEPFIDIKTLLLGNGDALCHWNNCDPLTTAAVYGIRADGAVVNCGRLARDGRDWLKCDRPGYERYLCLEQSPQDKGGCQGCRFFMLCGGGCPGEALHGDWRHRTEHCETWSALFRHYEEVLLNRGCIPVSAAADRAERLRRKNEQWGLGASPCGGHGDQHGDYTDISGSGSAHGDVPHGDRPHADGHGDEHGDHMDGR